jgi:arylsulfatase A-like enzyme
MMAKRPNVVLILADDLGFSDVGCYGGEISTPNIDAIASSGVRFAQFYNTARCSPSRASLLTGLHPHQAGIGILTNDDRPRGYPGTLNDRCLTVAEILGAAGYATGLVGKWHLASDMVNPNDAWPTRRGFGYFYGTLTGCGSYFQPGTLTRNETNIEDEPLGRDYYYTDAITDEADRFIRQHAGGDGPFFLYAAYTAPHWPLHACPEDVERYRGRFAKGWDELRQERMRRLRDAGILADEAALSERDPTQPAWDQEPDPEWQQRRMEAYAAQVDRMDQGVGRILQALSESGVRDDTVVIFLSDNGASPETLPLIDEETFRHRGDIFRKTARDGRLVRLGNEPDTVPGPEDTYASYGRAWANLSNTPFRFYKRWLHEGGISAPFVASWPSGGLAVGFVCQTAYQLTDVLPTILEITAVSMPADYPGRRPQPLEGRSMLPALRGHHTEDGTLYWEHTGNAAVRRGRWKLVREYPGPWELYDMATDRSELNDVAEQQPDVVAELTELWERWARRVGVIAWEVTVDIYLDRGLSDTHAAG